VRLVEIFPKNRFEGGAAINSAPILNGMVLAGAKTRTPTGGAKILEMDVAVRVHDVRIIFGHWVRKVLPQRLQIIE
jgi:hypothetical protein